MRIWHVATRLCYDISVQKAGMILTLKFFGSYFGILNIFLCFKKDSSNLLSFLSLLFRMESSFYVVVSPVSNNENIRLITLANYICYFL